MRIIKNFFWQLLAHGLGRGCMFVFYLLLPLVCGLTAYSRFALALSLGQLVAQPVMDMGLNLVVTKRVSRGESDVFQSAFGLRGLLIVGAGLLFGCMAYFFQIWIWLALLIFVYLAGLSLLNLLFAYYRGREWMQAEGVITAGQKGSALLFLGLIWLAGWRGSVLAGPLALMGSLLVGGVLFTALYASVFPGRGKSLPERQDVPIFRKGLLREGIVLGGIGLLGMFYFRIDSVLLGWLGSTEEVGLYNIAYRFMEGTFVLPMIVMLVFFPRLARKRRCGKEFKRLAVCLGTVGVLVAAGMWGISHWIIKLVYPPEMARAGEVLSILSLVAVPVYMGYVLTQQLVALDLQRKYLWIALAGAVLNAGLDVLLIPAYGPIGPAWSTLATECFISLAAAGILINSEKRISSSA